MTNTGGGFSGNERDTMSVDDERQFAKKAEETLTSLTLSTPRTDEIISALARAAGKATEGSIGLSGETALNYVRAATALRAVCLGVARQRLTQEMIDRAKLAVEAWASELRRVRLKFCDPSARIRQTDFTHFARGASVVVQSPTQDEAASDCHRVRDEARAGRPYGSLCDDGEK
jgi:hypothetical protein